MPTVPANPTISREDVIKLIQPLLDKLPMAMFPLVAFSIRGLRKEMGEPNKNDRGIWDDCNGWLERAPGGAFAAFTGNADPTAKYRKGLGQVHAPQIIPMVIGKHRGRPAFRQNGDIMVDRDGIGLVKASKGCAFNWHDSISSINGTSSLGCTTNPKSVFPAVRELGYHLVRKYYPKTETFNLLLVAVS